ncbi:MAG: hypothetical protein JKY53_06455 [Flavobacteriales bacterium]|nr:hypothetical protein [Flavobacteriales bacterium]
MKFKLIYIPLFVVVFCDTGVSFAGDRGDYINESSTYRLQLNDDNTYRLIHVEGENQYGKVYDKIGYWKEERGIITLYFTGYDMEGITKLEVDYTGCARIEKKPIAEYKYKKKGAKLKPLNPDKKEEIFVKEN